MFKTFKLLPNLFQKYGPIKEMPFWTKLLFFKGISRAICNLVLYVLLKGTKISFIQNGEVSFQYLKTFLVMRCSVLSFVDNNFICLISLASACSFEFSFKQNRVHLFWVACVIELKSYTVTYVILDLKTHFGYIIIVTLIAIVNCIDLHKWFHYHGFYA